MLYFVTLFDSSYMSRGLALYDSLMNNCENFILYIIAFDDMAYKKLIELELEHTVIVSLDEFEDEELLSVKEDRSIGEYCWTSTPKSIEYVLNRENCDGCTYLDADLFFFSNPKVLLDEIEENEDVLITEHRYTEEYNQTLTSGKYCVQFMYFKNNENGRNVLKYWKDRCIEWCYARIEEGRFGDQKYLDDWKERFSGIHEMQNLGGGIAPWNVQQYSFFEENNRIKFYHKSTNCKGNVFFYHFHNLKFFDKDVVQLVRGGYLLNDSAISYIYKIYIRRIELVNDKYKLISDRCRWLNCETFISDIDYLKHESNCYRHSLFL